MIQCSVTRPWCGARPGCSSSNQSNILLTTCLCSLILDQSLQHLHTRTCSVFRGICKNCLLYCDVLCKQESSTFIIQTWFCCMKGFEALKLGAGNFPVLTVWNIKGCFSFIFWSKRPELLVQGTVLFMSLHKRKYFSWEFFSWNPLWKLFWYILNTESTVNQRQYS